MGHIDTDFSRDIVIDTASVMGMAINSSITPTATLELVKHDKQHNSSSQQVDQFPGHIELQWQFHFPGFTKEKIESKLQKPKHI